MFKHLFHIIQLNCFKLIYLSVLLCEYGNQEIERKKTRTNQSIKGNTH